MAERLTVWCKACSKPFPSPIAMDRASFETATLSINSYQCPHCGESRSYEKEDHNFVEQEGYAEPE